MTAEPLLQASDMGDEEEMQEDFVMLDNELSDSRNSNGNWNDMEVDDELTEKRYDVFPAPRVTSCMNHRKNESSFDRASTISQRAEGRGQRSEDRGQRAEGRDQRADGRRQRADSKYNWSREPY